MNKLLFLLLFVIPTLLLAQVPEGLSYQGIALNSAGNQVKNANISLKISILDNAADGAVLYSETQTTTTSNKGLFAVMVGKGTVVSGTLATINWGVNAKYLKVAIDVAGGTNYIVVSNNQMLSVPYALYSGKTASFAGNTAINNEIVENRSSNFAFGATDGYVYVYNELTNTWSSQLGRVNDTNFGVSTLISSNKNFAFSATDGYVYVYNAKLNLWNNHLGSLDAPCDYSEPIVGSNGNFAFAATDGYLYVYNARLNTWSSQLGRLNCFYSGYYRDLFEINGNFAFSATDGYVYIYNNKLNSWSSQLGTVVNQSSIVEGKK
jgi:hypothetical protein